MISCKCKSRPANNILHVYIAEGNSFQLVYCVSESVQPLLYSLLLQWFPTGWNPLKSAPSCGGIWTPI